MNLAVAARRLGFSVWDWLHGAPVHRHLEELERAQSMSYKELELWQSERLHALLCHARDTTDFYRPLVPRDFPPEGSLEVLRSLPVVTKKQIKAKPEAFISSVFPRTRLHRGTTSGSTGSPFVFWMDHNRRARVRAEILYFGRWAGYEIGMRHCYLRYLFGRPKGFLQRWLENQLIIDTTSVDEARLEKIRTLLIRSRTEVLVSHPSVLNLLAKHCLDRIRPSRDFSLRSVISVGEPLLSATRASIEEAFGCLAFDRYGTWEFGVLASECEKQRLHVNVGSLYIELLPHEGHYPTAVGEPTQLIVTDLFNYGMPFLRYELGDVVVLDRRSCSCGRVSPLLSVVYGRVVDQITSADGAWLDPLGVGAILRDCHEIRQFQFVQQTQSSYLIKVIPDEGFDEEVTHKIVRRYRELLGQASMIRVQEVDEIQPLPSGKRSHIISEVGDAKTGEA